MPATTLVKDRLDFLQTAPLEQLFVRPRAQDGRASAGHFKDLYRRWEAQPWQALAINLESDVRSWPTLEMRQPPILRGLDGLYLGDKVITSLLPTIMIHAPSDGERIFLATQVADEARHQLFLHRYITEVVGISGGYEQLEMIIRERIPQVVLDMLDGHLKQAVHNLQAEQSTVAWVQAVVTYHLVLEGYLALQIGQYFQDIFSRFQITTLLGLDEGVRLLLRDESRHVGYGIHALHARVSENPELVRLIALRLLELGKTAGAIVSSIPYQQLSASARRNKLIRALNWIGLSPVAIETACRDFV